MPNTSWANQESILDAGLTIQTVSQAEEAENHIDYDVHGIVGIRLVDCPPKEAAIISGKFGLLQRSLERIPDIVVRFVEHIETPGLTHLGLRQYAFTETDFFLIGEKTGAKIQINFEQVGSRTCEIVCESGTPILALLTALINVTALKKNYVSLHASAFSYRGVGILVSGWKKGGKTETLLAFSARGARFIGDEWILLSGDGRLMHGIPGVIPLWDWHLKYLPILRRKVKHTDRALFAAVRWLDKLQSILPHGKIGDVLPLRFLRDALPPLKRRLNVAFDPEAVFSSPLGWLSACPEKIFLAVSHAENDIKLEMADPMQLAAHMAASVEFEQLGFFKHYLAFKFAFPERNADFMESVAQRQYSLLRRALSGKESYVVSHPYPVSLNDLSERMLPLLASSPKQSAA